jgi:DNA-binding NarL/FixJ family response regulator
MNSVLAFAYASRDELAAICEVVDGGAPMSPEVARRVVRLFREFQPPDHASFRLTPQETELLKLLADGHHRKTAADRLGISVNTVSFHLKNVYEKLQVHSKTEAVVKALRERLI